MCVCTNPVKLEVKSARVAHRIAAGVAPPQRCVGGGAVAAAGARPPRCRLLQKYYLLILTFVCKRQVQNLKKVFVV